jgi:hypothetical protein
LFVLDGGIDLLGESRIYGTLYEATTNKILSAFGPQTGAKSYSQ